MRDVTDSNNGLDALLSSRRVCEVLDVSGRQLRRLVAGGKFPRPDCRLNRSLRWKESTVRAFVERACGDGKQAE